MYNINTSALIDIANKLAIALSQKQLDQFVRYYELLIEKNKVMNLTAITEWDDVVTRHFADSLLICSIKDLSSACLDVLDMGTGAGFPGIPLKIAFPGLNMTLADSLNKRIRFLDEVIEELKLEGVRTVHARAEDLGHDPLHRERYDLVVSRAVANLSSLSEYTLPFVKRGGQFIAYKSTNIDMEYRQAERAIQMLGGQPESVYTTPLPGTNQERSFVVIKKVSPTSVKYPRKAGTPSKKPL